MTWQEITLNLFIAVALLAGIFGILWLVYRPDRNGWPWAGSGGAHAAPSSTPQPEHPVDPSWPPPAVPEPWSPEQRAHRLRQEVMALSTAGWIPVGDDGVTASLVRGQPVNHVLHLILTLVTCGAWAIVWIILAATGGQKHRVVWVTEYGQVMYR